MLANLPVVILNTILNRLATLFLSGAGGDIAAARDAALQMLAAYDPETVHELRLAAQIVSFSFHALEALGQAADPDQPLSRGIRLRGSAVSLSRESDKAQLRLEQSQQARQEAATQLEILREPAPRRILLPEPKIEQAPAPTQSTSAAPVPASTLVPAGAPTWMRSYDRPEDTARIAASLKRAEALVAARNAAQGGASQTGTAQRPNAA